MASRISARADKVPARRTPKYAKAEAELTSPLVSVRRRVLLLPEKQTAAYRSDLMSSMRLRSPARSHLPWRQFAAGHGPKPSAPEAPNRYKCDQIRTNKRKPRRTRKRLSGLAAYAARPGVQERTSARQVPPRWRRSSRTLL